MTFEYSSYILPLIAAAFVSVTVAIYAWMRRSATGALALFLMAFSISVWSVGYSLEIAGVDLETKYFWGVIQYIGIAFAPYGWLLFSIDYSGQAKIVTRRFVILTALIPTVTVLLALTTKWHGLIWSEYHIEKQGSFSALGVTHGVWFNVHFAYSYIILLIGTVLLGRALWRKQGMYRGQIFAMLVAVLAPWIGNALYLTGNSPIPYLDLTPFAFTVTVVALAWAIFGFHLVDITPLARDRVVDSMREGMIVLDVRAHIVDINNAAARMIGIPVANAIGKTAADVFSPWSHLVERFRDVLEARDEISVGEGEAKRRYEVRLSPLQDQQGQLVGRVIMLRAIDDEIPQPRFAAEAAIPFSHTHPLTHREANMGAPVETAPGKQIPIWNLLTNYYYAPVKSDLAIPNDINPSWYQTRERIFTIILRLAATIGLAALLFAAPTLISAVVQFVAAIAVVVLLWVLGLARNIKYELRVTTFLWLVYALGLVEMLNFGFSVESFAIFMTYNVVSAVLTSRRGSLYSLAIALVTMGIFAVLIGSKVFIPFMALLEGGIPAPLSIQTGITSLLVFTACAAAALASVIMLLENLNNAWQKETQALNLLQQERDLLEQRVGERTRDFAEAESKYRTLVEQLPIVVYKDMPDEAGKTIYISPQVETLLGYSLAEWEQDPTLWQKITHPDDLERTLAAIREVLSLGHSSVEYRLLARNRVVWVRDEAALVRDESGRPLFVQGVLEDITERKRVEGQIRKLSQAIEQSGSTVVITDTGGKIEYANPKFTETTGYTLEEAIGKNPRVLKSGRQSAEYYAQLWKTISGGNIWRGEFLNKRKDGSLYWENATIAPVTDQNGTITNYVAIKENITEQKIMQDQLQKQNEYLSILHQITLDLLNRRELNDLLQVIVDRSAILMDAPFSELMLEEDGVLVVKSFTDNQPNLKGDRVTRGQEILSWQAFDTHQPVILEDYAVWEHKREIYDFHSLHATADFPVMAGDRCLGILAVGRSQPNHTFTVEQVETGILFARLVALVLDNAHLYDSALHEIAERERAQISLQRLHQQQQAVNSLLKINLEDKSMDEVLDKILDEILSIEWLTVVSKGGFFLFNEQTNMLDLRVHRNLAPALQTMCSQIALGQCLCGRAALSRQVQFADCLDDRHEIRYAGIQEHGHYNIPILQDEHVLGVIVLYLSHGYQKTEDDLTFLRAAADAIAVILRRKQAEMLLLESEARFRQIVENASDIIYRTDNRGNFTYVNPTSLVMMGFEREEEVLGRNYLDLVVPEFKKKMKRFYDYQFFKKEKSTYYEFPALNTQGEALWFGQNVRLIEEGHAIIGFQAVARNITQLVQAREALALSRDQAMDASQFKSQLLSRVSHELRTPLGGILGYAELLQYKAFGSLTEKQLGAVDNIIESTNYLTGIVNDLLDESQIESKSISLHNEYFNPIELLEKIKNTMSTLADKKGLTFRVEMDPDLPSELYGDANRLQQVLINLAGNAIKFTKSGEVSVSLKRPAPAHWSFEVRDTGAGIPVDDQRNIFEPFRQVNNLITRENRGSGLGLAITKQLVELMGGQISLDSEVGKGSLFTVILPITNAPGE